MNSWKYFRNYFIGSLKLVNVLGVAVAITLILGGYESTVSNQREAPKIVIEGGEEILVLPKHLMETINSQFSGFRIPNQSDLTGAWAENKYPSSFPFITWGDFNGDSQTDVAVILISDKRWKFVIFHKTDRGYVAAYIRGGDIKKEEELIQVPQEIILRLIKKGGKWRPEGGDVPMEYKHEFDAIEFSLYRYRPSGSLYTPLSLIYWHNGKYSVYSDWTEGKYSND